MSLEITDELIASFPPEAQTVIRALLGEIAELKEKLGTSPRNSSVPPSSEHPHAKPPPKKKPHVKNKRKRGGQKGHPKHERELIPAEECDEVIPLKPTNCRRCGKRLSGEDAEPWRHQVWELPKIEPTVIEYQRHRLTCPCCSESTCAPLPDGVPQGQSGPRLIAFTAVLMAHFRQSKRRTALFLESLFGQPCSTGLVVKLQNIAAAALRPNYEELKDAIPDQPIIGGDESPTKEANKKAWVWTFVAGAFTVFAMRPTRAATVLKEFLGKFRGIINCDRAKMYWALAQESADECEHRLQWCWAHLQRDFQKLIDSPDHQVKRLGYDLMRPTKELFRQWAKCRDGTITHAEMKETLEPIREQVDALLLRGVFSGNVKLKGMCKELYDHRAWLWTFLDHEGVEPTNNASERSLRHAVIWRKLSFGTQSETGSRFVETMLTVIETCRQQERGVYEHITTAIEAHFNSQTPPSLLPGA